MKALKRALFTTTIGASFLMLAIGGYNSAIVDHSAFFKNDLGIKLAKRLDEIKGEIVIGRMAASLPSFQKKSKTLIKKQTAKILKKKKAVKKEVVKNIPAPVVNEDLELSLTGGFYNKKSLDQQNNDFSGVAIVNDGVIEEISVSLPGGGSFSINTNERMVGNVFSYEDTGTRERKSALFYKVKTGVYMVTLTDDTQYPGLRLEFKADNVQELEEGIVDSANWALNKQNQEKKAEENNQESYDENQAYNEEVQEQPEQDFYQEAASDQGESSAVPVDQSVSYGFNFNS